MILIRVWGCLFFSVPVMGQAAHLPSENGYMGSGAYSTHFMDAFSFSSNPACLAELKGFLGGVRAERKWMLPELDECGLAVATILGGGGMGILLQRNGDAGYYEQAGELGYGKNMGRLGLGIRFGYIEKKASGYPRYGFGYAGIGIRVKVSENLITGWEMDLPVFGKAGKINPEKGPQSFRMGFGYEWGTDLFLAFQVIKASGYPVNVFGSVAYCYDEQFFFSFGINSSTGVLEFQSGWGKNRLCIKLYTSFEPVLGFSPGVVVLWKGKNKKG